MAPPSLPPSVNLLTVFDQFLKIQKLRSAQSTENAIHQSLQKQKQHDEILILADFLFSSSCLDGALHVLESGNDNSRATPASFCSSVTRLQSPRRVIYHVKGTPATNRGIHAATATTDAAYLCIVPECDQEETGRDTRGIDDVTGMHYCSCRSFLEKSRCTPPGTATICKHLLALKLMPALGVTPSILEFASDEEFSQAVTQRLCPRNCAF
jgi:SWIM zinc finger